MCGRAVDSECVHASTGCRGKRVREEGGGKLRGLVQARLENLVHLQGLGVQA